MQMVRGQVGPDAQLCASAACQLSGSFVSEDRSRGDGLKQARSYGTGEAQPGMRNQTRETCYLGKSGHETQSSRAMTHQ